MRNGRRAGENRGIHALVVAAALLPAAAPAAQQSANWLGGSGNWTDATKWSGGIVPNNASTTTYTVNIDAGNPAASTVSIPDIYTRSTYAVDGITIDAGDYLSVGLDTLTVNQTFSLQGSLSLGLGALVNLPPNTVLNAGTLNWHSDASIGATSGTLTLTDGLKIVGGSGFPDYVNHMPIIGSTTARLINQMNFEPTGTMTIFAGSSIENHGSFTVSPGSRIGFIADSTLAGLGTLVNNGGIFIMGGTLENGGQTFRVDKTTGQWHLAGTVRGGTIETGDGMVLTVPYGAIGRLDNAAVNGRIEVVTELTVPAGQSFHGTGTIAFGPGAGAPEGGGFVYAESGDTVIDAGLTVSANVGNFSLHERTINHGTISTGAPVDVNSLVDIELEDQSVLNDGTLEVGPGARMHSFWHMTFLDGGRLLVDGGGELQSPTLDLSTTSDVLDVAPQAGGSPYSHYLIAEYGTLTGTFDHVTPGISVDYSTAGKIYITGTPVPEPAAAVIAAAGALLFRRRR